MNKKTFVALLLTLIAFALLTIQHITFAASSNQIKMAPLPKGYYGPPSILVVKPTPKGCMVELTKKSPVKSKGCLSFHEGD